MFALSNILYEGEKYNMSVVLLLARNVKCTVTLVFCAANPSKIRLRQ